MNFSLCLILSLSLHRTYAIAVRKESLAPFTNSSRASITTTRQNSSLDVSGTDSDQCWAEWTRYWSLSTKVATMATTYTETFTRPVITYWTVPTSETTLEFTETVTEGNGNFPTKTYVTTITTEEEIWASFSTWTETVAEPVTSRMSALFNSTFPYMSSTITPPPCALPSSMPQCQTSWDSWVAEDAAASPTPECSQAIVSGSLCKSAQSQWLRLQSVNNGGEVDGKVGLQASFFTFTENGTTTTSTSTYWPTSSVVVPGCTVGCQSCRISGSNVKLLYWPPATASAHNGNRSISTAKPSNIVTAIAYGTTLTSPTVYISFDRLHASNSCKVIGQTLHNIIVPITNSATLSSLYGWGRYWGAQATASFNFTDLMVHPVPNSIYQSQPRCASSSTSLMYSCLTLGTTGPPECQSVMSNKYECPRTLPYEPVIAIPAEVQHLQPEWIDCIGGLEGVYDPPSALQPAAAAALPTLPSGVASTSAKTTEVSNIIPTTSASPSPVTQSIPPPTQSAPNSQQTQNKPQVPSEPSSAAQSSTLSNPEVPTDGTSGSFQQSSPSDQSSQSEQAADPSPTNAAEVLSSALNALPTSNDASADRPESMTDPLALIGSAASDAQSATELPSVVFTANDQIFTAAQQSSNAVLIDETTTATLNAGFSSVIGSQTIVVESGGLVIADPSTNLPQLSSINPDPPAAVWTASGATISAIVQSSNIILIGKQSTATITSDDIVTFAGQTLQAAPSGQDIIIDGSLISFTQPPLTSEPPAWTSLSQQGLSADLQGSNIIIVDPDTTITLPPNSVATLGSQTFSAASNAVVIDGSSIPLPEPTPQIWTDGNGNTLSAFTESNSIILIDQSSTFTVPGSNTVATLGGHTYNIDTPSSSNDDTLPVLATPTLTPAQSFSAEDIGSSVIIYGESTTLTLPDDSRTSIEGAILSVPTSGGGVVVNDSTTVTATFPTSSTEPARTSTITGTSKGGRVSVNIEAVLIAMVLLLLMA